MLLEELALFQSRLEGRPISTEEAMRLNMEQLVESLFPVRCELTRMPTCQWLCRAGNMSCSLACAARWVHCSNVMWFPHYQSGQVWQNPPDLNPAEVHRDAEGTA